jgi:NAD+ synthase (glutamine-hydrolysing)
MSRIALAQINPHVGALQENIEKMLAFARQAEAEQAELILFPELSLSGYPPEDLLLRAGFIAQCEAALQQLARESGELVWVVGHPARGSGGLLYNAASVLRNGRVVQRYYKQELPNYGVFDEKRYFTPGQAAALFDLGGEQLALTICEDLWHPRVVRQAVDAGATLILNLNASPYHAGKRGEREMMIRQHAVRHGVPIVYVNQVGGQDELIFDGASFVMGEDGQHRLCGSPFEEALYLYDSKEGTVCPPVEQEEEAEIYSALVQATRDYVQKNGFPGVILGLSGGIDSALTLAIAVDALGAEQVEAVSMPSRYTADMSVEDAEAQARRLGVRFRLIPIKPSFDAFLETLEEEFAGTAVDASEENIQARCRGVILMAIANKKNRMLLTTGNKSEMSVGYATLYGDMAGGFAPLKDLSKLLVYRLSGWRNQVALAQGEAAVIPQRVIDRPPSAELAPEQKDSDTLPPYEVLDPILQRYIEQDQCAEEIIAAGFEAAVVERVLRLVDGNEYKRRQAPPGARITTRAFGRDRRYPITSGFRSR